MPLLHFYQSAGPVAGENAEFVLTFLLQRLVVGSAEQPFQFALTHAEAYNALPDSEECNMDHGLAWMCKITLLC